MVMTPAPARPRPPFPRGPRPVPTSERKRGIAKALRKAADGLQHDHPETILHQHLRDAAAELDRGKTSTAIRHLQTAAHGLTPQSMYRHGATTDDAHTAARRNMHVVTRHILLIKDTQDQDAENRARIERRSYDTSTAQSGSAPYPVVTTDPRNSAVATRPNGPAAMNAPNRTPTGGAKGVAGAPKQPPSSVNNQYAHIAAAGGPGGIYLSAQTARLAVTPAPRGKPGGPGLYDVKGLGHTPYLQNVVKALIRRGMPPGKAYAIARASIRKWSAKSKHPEVRAAATAAESGELAKQAQAHAHAAEAMQWELVVELVGTAAGAALDPRTATGQFGTGGQGAAGKQGAAAVAQRKAALLHQARADRVKAAVLSKQLAALQHSSKAATKKAAAATKAGATGKTASATPAKKTTPAKAKPGAKKMTRAQQIISLRSQIAALLKQAAADTAAAAKL